MKRLDIYSVKLVKEKSGLYDIDSKRVNSSKVADEAIRVVLDLNNEAVEKFGILTLTTKNDIAGIHIISMGDLSSSIVNPREVFKPAILNNAAAIIMFHNHPSGDTKPSSVDIETTKKLVEAGKLLSIKVLDHIIVGEGYTSLAEEGLI